MDNDNSMLVAGLAQRVVGQIEQATGLKKELLDAQRQAARADDSHSLRLNLNMERDANGKLREALSQKEALLKEWMHSQEAFRRLAKKYGKKLGVSDEQRNVDLDEEILAIAEEKPELSDTKILKEVKEARGLK